MSLVTTESAPAALCMEAVAELLLKGASLDALESSVQLLQDRLGDAAAGLRVKVAFATMVALDTKRSQVGAV